MKKKYGLFKNLAVLLLLVVVTTYFVEGRDGSIKYLALGDLVLNYVQSLYYFFETAIFILVVGGFYGFLNRVPAYKKLVKGSANKVSSKSTLIVIIATILFAVLSSLTGFNLLMLMFVPFVVSIILLLGYDKLVALSATIGGVIVGIMGGVFLTLRDANSYESLYITFDKFVGLDSNWVNVLPRVALLVIATGLLVFYIISHIKKVNKGEAKYSLTKSDSLFVEVKDRTGKAVLVDDSKVNRGPLVIALVLLVVILVLGYFPWESLFGIKCFTKFHTWLLGIKIGKYEVYSNLISPSIGAFGSWGSIGNYMMAMFMVLLFSLVIMLVYRVKFEDAMDGFVLGIKKMVPSILVFMLAGSVLVATYNNGFVETIITKAAELGDNVVVHSLITMLGTLLINVESQYLFNSVFTNILTNLTDSANLSIYSVMFQSVYGLVQVIAPTSVLLIVGLSYLDVPYKTWLKYIWRFVIELIIVVLLVLMVVSLI